MKRNRTSGKVGNENKRENKDKDYGKMNAEKKKRKKNRIEKKGK